MNWKEKIRSQGCIFNDDEIPDFVKWCGIASNNCGKFYVRYVGLDNKQGYLHRLLAGTPKGMWTDHINGNTLDNRKENLRICTPQENARNRRVQSNCKAGYFGAFHYANQQ